jgi:hypothetical protein
MARAKNLALRNSTLAQRDLNFAVQRIIDRIIFLRIAEDRGIIRKSRPGAVAVCFPLCQNLPLND